MTPAPDALAVWLEQRFGGPVGTVEPARTIADGFDSEIHLVHLRGPHLPSAWSAPLVIRVKSDGERLDEARREAAVQGWVADQGYPAPRVLEVFEPGVIAPRPAQVMERAPGAMVLDRVRRAPWETRRLLRRLAALQAQLHRLPTEGFPPGPDLVDHRLRLPRHVAEAVPGSPIGAAIARIEPLLPRLRSAPPAVCHGDFHPLNVLVDGAAASVIDWTDAGLGDRHGDVARTLVLFDVAWIAAGSAPERALLRTVGPRLTRTYRRAYSTHLPLDPRALAAWVPLHLLHGWSQTVALHARMFDRDDDVADDRPARVPASLGDELARRFDAAVDEASR